LRSSPPPTPLPYTTLFRSRERPAPGGVGHANLETVAHPFHQGREPHPDPHAPQRERRDEEVVPLAHLARQLLLRLPRIAVLEIQDRKSTRLNSSHEWISYA